MRSPHHLLVLFTASLALAAALPARSQDEGNQKSRIRVACVGDSITFGAGIKDRKNKAYPVQLQALLGDSYEVRNFGDSGSTLLKKGDRSYWDRKAYKNALAFNPHLVFIKLGTNDSKPQNWKHKSEFVSDYKDLIESFRALDSKPTVYICTAAPVFPERWGITETVVKNEVIPLALQAAGECKVPTVDLYEALEGRADLFPDKVHPNAGGAEVIAAVIYAEITGKPLNGENLANWRVKTKPKGENKWKIGVPVLGRDNPKAFDVGEGTGAMVNDVSGHGQSFDIYSVNKFGDCRLEVELMVAKGSNSGVYMMGEYEVQVLDSYGKPDDKLGAGDMGAIYGVGPAAVNACKKPGEWQKYVIDWQAPRFDDSGKKTANAKFIKIELNGKTLHENVELKGSTGGALRNQEAARGPIMFQGDHGPVAFRNLEITETEAAAVKKKRLK